MNNHPNEWTPWHGICDTRKVIYTKLSIIIITKLKKVLQYVIYLFISFSKHANLINKSLTCQNIGKEIIW
jgi:hypothetical protein